MKMYATGNILKYGLTVYDCPRNPMITRSMSCMILCRNTVHLMVFKPVKYSKFFSTESLFVGNFDISSDLSSR